MQVSGRLKGGVQGDFFEEGSRLDEKHREGQLRQLFRLTEKIAKLNANFEKRKRAEGMEIEKTKQGASAAHESAVATRKSVIWHDLALSEGDTQNRIERLEEANKKQGEQIKAFLREIESMKSQLKECQDQTSQNALKLGATDKKLAQESKTSASVSGKVGVMVQQIESIKSNTSSALEESISARVAVNLGKERIDTLDESLEDYRGFLDRSMNTVANHATMLERHTTRLNEQTALVNSHTSSLDSHDSTLISHAGSISGHTDLLSCHSSHLEGLRQDLDSDLAFARRMWDRLEALDPQPRRRR